MALLFNTLSRLAIVFLPRSKCLLISWLQPPCAVISEPKKRKSVTVSVVSPSICHEVIGQDAMKRSDKIPWSYFSECWVLRLCNLRNSPGQETGVGSLSLLQRIFPTKESNPGLPHYRRILNQPSWFFTRSSPTCSCPWSEFLIQIKHCEFFFPTFCFEIIIES